ncbi:hypothetical protein GGR88_002530 [Sphingomonas jejuensis]|uniref:Transferrin-binding protein B C-lobe/N-lobe beta barrel domain-containing protein n=1 Tax=Sphingomonas jejuensis TaxID=904715 RepID=A0ABX0XQP3_9SPHN|nr:hypothetical protein [Sphingomonas jejuensis]
MSAISSSRTGHDGTVAVEYDATTGSYRVVDGSLSRSFTAADEVERDATVTVYEQVSGNRTDQLTLFNPGSGNPDMALSYTSYGAWTTMTSGSGTADFDQRYFVYGVRQAASAPSTGRGSYTTSVNGMWATADGVYELGGISSLTADFSSMTVETNLDLTGTMDGTTRSLGMFAGTGSIAARGGSFSGSFTHLNGDDRGNLYTGGFDGAFFGPGGEEVGYSFSLTGPGGAAAGAVVGKGN